MAIYNGWRITRAGVVFVAGIIVLAALVFGGIWLVRERGEQARRAEAVAIAEQNLQAESEATPPAETGSEEASSTTETTETGVAVTEGTQAVAGTDATELPATGADLSSLVIVTIVSLAISYFVASRRALLQS